ncbi:hypothetical protein GXP67_05575 [Rhodocytophaga rosea]|uniref:Uncharacterized protein n=1 Tax=Rhodocytophaga rosea TaxID=2704465 RepID=A0A6C0GDY4_9BACT|nr:hypothetical protein [Rhodocytophaga rosea]QHT66175.1 hypothetical protein GXP67_05575 [Rhodocytophaga rosea]
MTRIYHTSKIKEIPPYGAFEDEIIFQVQDNSESFIMRKYEFDWLADKMFDNWQQKRNPYIQILKEWNECIGFQDVEGQVSLIKDVADTIEALKMIEPSEDQSYNGINKEDIELLLLFLERNKDKPIEISES